jgi:hypothetical protein
MPVGSYKGTTLHVPQEKASGAEGARIGSAGGNPYLQVQETQ